MNGFKRKVLVIYRSIGIDARQMDGHRVPNGSDLLQSNRRLVLWNSNMGTLFARESPLSGQTSVKPKRKVRNYLQIQLVHGRQDERIAASLFVPAWRNPPSSMLTEVAMIFDTGSRKPSSFRFRCPWPWT